MATSAVVAGEDDVRQVGGDVGAIIERHLRVLAAAVTAGLLVAFIVNGWGMRLAMMLLARLNPEATGVTSDDGFIMGQFTLGNTLSLVAFGTVTGVIGAVVYLMVRHLRFGPGWWRTLSMALGPAVIVGNILVHTDGVDFRLLHPRALTIGLFVFLPGVFALVLAAVVDRWTAEGAWFTRGSRWKLAPLVVLGPLFILVPPTIALVASLTANDTSPGWHRFAGDARLAWVARLALTAIFAFALAGLIRKTMILL